MTVKKAQAAMAARKAEHEAVDVQADALAVWLAQGGQVIEWARKHKVAPRTAYRLSHSNECVARIAEIRHAVASGVVGKITNHALEAVEVIVGVMKSETAPETTRLAAAKLLLERVVDLASWSSGECQLAGFKREVADAERNRDETDLWCDLTG